MMNRPQSLFNMSAASTALASAVPADPVVPYLNFALTLEYLEADFYTRALAASGFVNGIPVPIDGPLIPSSDLMIFQTISDHENQHVAALKDLITSLHGTPVTKPTFNFSAGVGFNFLSTQYNIFLELSQAFEDTGVRAYKGQVVNLVTNTQALVDALSIHAVEAEHASEVRRLRAQKGWITDATTDISFAAATYAGEGNTTQGTVDIAALATAGGYPASAATEAFDEPLTQAQVLAIVNPFITGGALPG